MTTADYQQVVTLAKKLSVDEKKQLIEAMTAELTDKLADEQTEEQPNPRRSLRGLWQDVNISSEDIDDARREMWGDFPREDIE